MIRNILLCSASSGPASSLRRKKKETLNMKQRIRRVLPLLVLVALGLAGHARINTLAQTPVAASDRLTPAQTLNLQNISDLHFSPDGQLVAFVVTEPVKGTTRARHIWLLDVKTKTVRQFTNSVKAEDSPRWSPDGKRLAFLSNRDEFRQIYLISLDGGEAKRLTE